MFKTYKRISIQEDNVDVDGVERPLISGDVDGEKNTIIFIRNNGDEREP